MSSLMARTLVARLPFRILAEIGTHPGVTDESDRLTGLVDLPRQAQDFLGSPELIGSESTGDHERVEIGGVYLINARVHRDRIAALSLICAFTHAGDGCGRPFFF